MVHVEGLDILQIMNELDELTIEERAAIKQVAERDQQLRSHHENQLQNLKNEVNLLQRTWDAECDFQLNKNACALCIQPFRYCAFISGYKCPRCIRTVCSTCRIHVELPETKWMCLLCYKKWELRTTSGDWLDCSLGPHVPVSSVILKTLLRIDRPFGNLLDPNDQRRGKCPLQTLFTQAVKAASNQSISQPTSKFNPHFSRLFRKSNNPSANEPKSDSAAITNQRSIISRFSASFHNIAAHLLHVQSEAVISKSPLQAKFIAARSLSADHAVDQADLEPEPMSQNSHQMSGKVHFDLYTSDEEDGKDGKHEKRRQSCVTEMNTSQIIKRPASSTPNYLEVPGRRSHTVTMPQPAYANGDDPVSSINSEQGDPDDIADARNRIIAALNPTGGKPKVHLQIGFDYEDGFLEVMIFKVKNIPHLDQEGDLKPSPYVKVKLCGEKGNCIKAKTKTVFENRNPEYNHLARFLVKCESVASWYLRIEVCHKRRFPSLRRTIFARPKVLASTVMLITEELLLREEPTWIELQKNPSDPEAHNW